MHIYHVCTDQHGESAFSEVSLADVHRIGWSAIKKKQKHYSHHRHHHHYFHQHSLSAVSMLTTNNPM